MINQDEIKGEVISKIYFNEENNFFVARIKYKDFQPIVSGKIAFIEEGQILQAKGKWTVDPKHGRQFKADDAKALPPTSEQSLINFLSSKAVKGVGPSIAKKLVEVHGMNLIDLVINQPDIVLKTKIKGIGDKKLTAVVDAIQEHKEKVDLFTSLGAYGISPTYCIKIFNCYQHKALSIVQTNPYKLSEDIVGIGFKLADKIALNVGIAKDSEFRIQAGVLHTMNSFRSKGYCGVLKKDLLIESLMLINDLNPDDHKLKSELNINSNEFVIDKNQVGTIIKKMIDSERLIKDTVEEEECIFIPDLYYSEKGIAKCMSDRLRTKNIDSHSIDQYISKAEQNKQFFLGNEQRKAVEKALSHNTLILTGGPGTGKTSTVNIITHIFNSLGKKIWICAPSGKAAKRAQEVTGFEAQTIHRMIGLKGFEGNKVLYHADNPMPCDLLIVDESSMIDVNLFYLLIKAVSVNTTLVIVGDVDQLPSVGPGKVLSDLLDSNLVPTQRLTEVRRQAQDSSIIKLAYKINNAVYPSLKEYVKDHSIKDDLIVVPYVKEAENTNQYHLIDLINQFKKKGFDPIKDMQFLAPMRNGLFGIDYINKFLKAKLNPQQSQIKIYGYDYAVKDKVIQLKNNYDLDIYNGDIGYIQELNPLERFATILFDDKLVTYPFEDFNELALAYCISIHKSQGGEFPVVFMMMTTSHYIMLKRNLAYTGITRAKQHLILMTDKNAMRIAVDTVDMQNRHTKLKEFLINKKS